MITDRVPGLALYQAVPVLEARVFRIGNKIVPRYIDGQGNVVFIHGFHSFGSSFVPH